MGQDLLKITPEELYYKVRLNPRPLQLYKQLVESIYEFKAGNYKKLGKLGDAGVEVIKDLELKETKIMRALIELGYNLKTPEFQAWYKGVRNRATKKIIVMGD